MLTMGKPLKVGGTAWAYLVDSVSGELAQGAEAARYYGGQGTPPGKFVGKGLVGLGDHLGAVTPADLVSPEMLYRMLVLLADPLTGEPLGRPPSTTEKAPVAGYDLTFSVPKSLSLMWAMGDGRTRTGIRSRYWNGRWLRWSIGPRTTRSSAPAPVPRAPARNRWSAWWPAPGCTTRQEMGTPSSMHIAWPQ